MKTSTIFQLKINVYLDSQTHYLHLFVQTWLLDASYRSYYVKKLIYLSELFKSTLKDAIYTAKQSLFVHYGPGESQSYIPTLQRLSHFRVSSNQGFPKRLS